MKMLSNSYSNRLVLLAPAEMNWSPGFGRCARDGERHDSILSAMQRFRGSVYLADGAIRPSDLTVDGRHRQASDYQSWHLISIAADGKIIGCSRYRQYDFVPRYGDLGLSQSELANSDQWGTRLQRAVCREFSEASRRRINVVEVGGWAVAEEYRYRAEALRLALSTYGLARLLGGCIGFTTATVRHCSASILRKLGGQSLTVDGEEIPRYFDTRYNCEMEILRFDSEEPNPRFAQALESLGAELASREVISPEKGQEPAAVPGAGGPPVPTTPREYQETAPRC
jgi:hypothetical protein